MSSREFAYWLQGYFEINGESKPMTIEQVDMVKRHLSMVFTHEIDPSYPAEQQDKLNELHSHKPNQNRPDYLVRC